MSIIDKINKSASFEEAKEDVLNLAAAIGMRETISSIFEEATTDWERGMAVAKVFDTFAAVPEMSWLPDSIKALYKPSTPGHLSVPQTEQFKHLFSAYCKQEIAKGHCEADCCDICPVNRAYSEIFDKFADEEEEE